MNSKLRKLAGSAVSTIAAMAVSVSCTDKDEGNGGTKLDLNKEEVIVIAPAGTAEIQITSDMRWSIETAASWFRFNVTEGRGNAAVTITYDENPDFGSREMTVVVKGVIDGFEETFLMKQFGLAPVLEFAKYEETVRNIAGNISLGVTTNLTADEIDFVFDYCDGPQDWIISHALNGQQLDVAYSENTSETDRSVNIELTHKDVDPDNPVSTVLKLTQLGNVAVAKTIPEVKALSTGRISENIYVQGYVVAVGHGWSNPGSDAMRDYNNKKYQYIIQDASGNSLVFRSGQEDYKYDKASNQAEPDKLAIELGDVIQLSLMDAEIVTENNGGGNFPVVQGITDDNVTVGGSMSQTAVEITIDQLTDAHINTLVTLKDVEVAVPVGYWSNEDRGRAQPKHADPANADYLHPNPNSATLLRDGDGKQIHVLTDFFTSWTYGYNMNFNPKLPAGSGKLTGIVVRESHSRMVTLTPYQIRPRGLSDIGIADNRASVFSEVIAEWSCAKPATLTGSETTVPLTSGSDASATLFKSNGTGLTDSNDKVNIFYGADMVVTGVSNGALYASGWKFGESPAAPGSAEGDSWWLMSFSTLGINSLVSVQFNSQSSSPGGPAEMVAEYSLDNSTWLKLGDYDVPGQLNAANLNQGLLGTFRTFSFNLPSEANNKSKVYVRMRARSNINVVGETGIGDTETNRLSNVIVKYTK